MRGRVSIKFNISIVITWLQISNANTEEPAAEGQQWWELYMKEGHTVLISYFSPHSKREKKQCRKCPETSSEQAAHHVLALPLMASSNKFRCARVKIQPCSTHTLFFNLLPGGSYTSSLSSKCLPCLCLNLVSSPSICNKLMVCSIHLYITSQLFCMSSLLSHQICTLEKGYKLQTVLQPLQPDSHVHRTWIIVSLSVASMLQTNNATNMQVSLLYPKEYTHSPLCFEDFGGQAKQGFLRGTIWQQSWW